MQRKTVLITGGNSGIGLAIAHEVAARGARLCLACRDQQKARQAIAEIQARTPGAEIELYALDLSSFARIRAFAGEFLAKHPVVDVLVNNAGAYVTGARTTEDGFEMTFGANTLGPILLTELLLPAIEQADDGRIVHLASMGHLGGRINFDSFRGRKPYFSFPAYAQSKLGNLLYSNALSRRTKVPNNAVHPGAVDSPLYRELPPWLYATFRWALIGPEKAGELVADLALKPEHRTTTGRYLAAQPPGYSSKRSRDVALQDRFYETCCGLVGVPPRPVIR